MRLAFRIDPHHLSLCAALYAALAVITLPLGANAQEPAQGSGNASSNGTGSVTLASTTLAAATAPAPADAANHSGAASNRTGAALSVPADATSLNDFSLDDQMLSRQRGGFNGMLMVAATPQLMRSAGNGGNGVTLWDEIAPPSPLPIPLDAAANAQGNVAAYQRR